MSKKLLVRIEKVHNSTNLLLIDEIGRFVGEFDDMYFTCELWDGSDTFEEEGEVWFRINANNI